MFWRKSCNFCGYKLKKDWNFCPKCGNPIGAGGIMRDVFEDIEKEFERIDKMFRIDTRELGSQDIRGGSLHITIQSGTGIQPKIEVKTTGDYKALEPEIKRKLGISEEKVEERARKFKITEEPETKKIVQHGKTILKIELPGVKSEDDIEIKRLEQSIEIKAFAGDKAYFKLIPIPENASISKRFKDGILEIEIQG